MFVQLKERDHRPPLDVTLAQMRRALSEVAGLKTFIVPVQSLRFGGRSTQSQYQVVLKSLNADDTRQWSTKLQAAMAADSAHYIDVATDLQNNALQADIDIDNDRANALGITSASIRNILEAAFGTLDVTQIQTTGNSYNVILELNQNRSGTRQVSVRS